MMLILGSNISSTWHSLELKTESHFHVQNTNHVGATHCSINFILWDLKDFENELNFDWIKFIIANRGIFFMFFPSWNFFVHKEINSKLFFQKFKQVFPLEARSLALDHFQLKFHIAIQTLYIKIILCSHLTLKSFIWSPS